MAESACNLNKPEKQTQHCDTVKEELPVAKAWLNNSSSSSRIKDVTEVERERERARYALLRSWPRTCAWGGEGVAISVSGSDSDSACRLHPSASAALFHLFIYLKAVYVLVKLQIKFLITN